MIRLNLIKDNEVSTEDANLAKKVDSIDARSLEGRSARSKLAPVVDNIVEILDEFLNINEKLKLSTDRLLVNGLNFATTIVHDFFHRCVKKFYSLEEYS